MRDDDRYDILAVPEHARRHLVRKPDGEFLDYIGVEIGGRFYDLRSKTMRFSGYPDGDKKRLKPKLDLEPIEALVNLEEVDIERAFLRNQRSLQSLKNVKRVSLFDAENIDGYFPPHMESLSLRFARIVSLHPLNRHKHLRAINLYGSDVADSVLTVSGLPTLEFIELYGTPVATKVNGAFNMARFHRIVTGRWRFCSKQVVHAVASMEERGVDVSFKYDPPYL